MTEPLSPVPGHIKTAGTNAGYFCSREGQLTPGGRCPDGCDHADHYSNDGHPECEDDHGPGLRLDGLDADGRLDR